MNASINRVIRVLLHEVPKSNFRCRFAEVTRDQLNLVVVAAEETTTNL